MMIVRRFIKHILIALFVIEICCSLGVWVAGYEITASFMALHSSILALSFSAIKVLEKQLAASAANCKLSATQLARLHKTSSTAIQDKLISSGYITNINGIYLLSKSGRRVGGEIKKSHLKASDHEVYFVWPANILSIMESAAP